MIKETMAYLSQYDPEVGATIENGEVARRTKNPGLQYGFRIPLATPEET